MNKIIQGDCIEKLKELPENSVDSIVTDPPYHLVSIVKRWGKPNQNIQDNRGISGPYGANQKGFMGKDWDGVDENGNGIAMNVDMWKECLRVLKPGGYLLSFGGTRTYHRMACAIEDAGFEVRDMIEWVYGSGFPKSLNIGKAVDKLRKGSDKLVEFSLFIKNRREEMKISQSEADKFICGGTTMYSFFEGRKDKPLYFPNNEHYKKMKELFLLDDTWDKFVVETNENIVGFEEGDFGFQKKGDRWDGKKKVVELSKRASEWEGWGTALKPAHEPICMARKPLAEKTVAENVLRYRTGGINIDESRVKGDEIITTHSNGKGNTGDNGIYGHFDTVETGNERLGRFPANLIHDNSEEVRECFPETGKSTGGRIGNKGSALNMMGQDYEKGDPGFGDSGSASRFFKSIIYQAKASKSERNKGMDGIEAKPMYKGDGSAQSLEIFGSTDGGREDRKNNHPTVKPIALMEYLIKMVTPPGGIVLDPFSGSGSTLVAAKQNDFQYIGIELTPEYIPIIEARLAGVVKELTLF